MPAFDPYSVVVGVLFGIVGLSAFVYGKKESAWRPMILGAALMGFPYLVDGTVPQLAVGAVLTLLLFFPKE